MYYQAGHFEESALASTFNSAHGKNGGDIEPAPAGIVQLSSESPG